MEINKIGLEFENSEINVLVQKLNELFKHQQVDFANLCYVVYTIHDWFYENKDEVLKSKTNDYYNEKQLFKALGFTTKQVYRYCKCCTEYMEKDDVGFKLREVFSGFSESKLIELLPLGVKASQYINSGQLNSNMTVKEIRAFMKTLEDTSSENLEDEESGVIEEEPNFLVLKNDTARKDFLDNYKTWGLWFEEPRLKLKYYRCKIGDKVLVAINSFVRYVANGITHEVVGFHYLNSDGAMALYDSSLNEIISKMKSIPDKRVYLLD